MSDRVITECIEHIHFSPPSPEPVKIKIERGQKGGYGWEISVVGDNIDQIIEHIAAADARLRKTFLVEVA
jgi:hypothetical protein